MYSALAGFVEPGETLENAVMREVQEETGVQVQEVCYHSSQPWPFPASLMLGFTAGARRGPVTLKDQELEDARWFSRPEMASLMERGELKLPPAYSIAYHLIEDWYNMGSQGPLKGIHATIGSSAS
jgi:NAD+ diphosphatase